MALAAVDEDETGIEYDDITGEAILSGGSFDVVWDLQATHGSKIAAQGYAVHIDAPGRLTPAMMETYKAISGLWHQFLLEEDMLAAGGKTKSGTERDTARKRARRGLLSEDERERKVGRDMKIGLEALLGRGATWRSAKQRESMETILGLQGDSSTICVLPTGAGKSVLFMLPAALADGGTSVVIVPFTALLNDLLQRARELGIDALHFTVGETIQQERLPRLARLVIISADTISHETAGAYVDTISSLDQLRRIYVDEAHTAITDSSYRHQLTLLGSIRRFKAPVVMLTATLPINMMKWFRRAMVCEDAVLIRDRTTKLNCSYAVERVGAGEAQRRTIAIARELGAQMTGHDKGIIYCRSQAATEALAEELGCSAHHSGMGGTEREEVLRGWAEGRTGHWLAATTGVGAGIHVRGIAAVLHCERPYGMVDHVQQTGRGGREAGETVKSIIVYSHVPQKERAGATVIESMNNEAMRNFMLTSGCRRTILGVEMDGVGGGTCESIEGAIRCDNCRGGDDSDIEEEGEIMADDGEGMGAAEESEDEGQEREEGEGEEVYDGSRTPEGVWTDHCRRQGRDASMLRDWLDEVQFECVLCFVAECRARRAGQAAVGRVHQGGNEMCEPVAGREYKQLRQGIEFGANACCFRCKLPLDWCDEAKAMTGSAGCCYADKVLPLVLFAAQDGELSSRIEEEFDVSPGDEKGWLSWLAGGNRFHGTKGTNMHWAWELIVRVTYGEGDMGWRRRRQVMPRRRVAVEGDDGTERQEVVGAVRCSTSEAAGAAGGNAAETDDWELLEAALEEEEGRWVRGRTEAEERERKQQHRHRRDKGRKRRWGVWR